MELLQMLVNGILLGGVYAMVGLGLTIVFGIVGLTNLAHGEFVILGAYASTLLSGILGIDPILTLILTVPVMFGTGYLLQMLLLNPAMERGSEAALLVTFALSIILQDGMLLLLSADARHTAAAYSLLTLRAGGLNISVLNLVLFGVSMLYIAGLTLFLRFSHTGRAIRAVSDDRDAARLSGIPVRRVLAVAMGIAMASAAVAGLCVSMKWTYYPSSGGQYLLTAFIVVVLGGMNNILGTLLAGLGFGIAQVIGGANYGLLISYAAILLILAIRPPSPVWQ